MKYSCRPGIVLTKICGQWLLIPIRAASEQGAHVISLTLPAMLVWKMLEKRKDKNDILKVLSVLTKKDDDEAGQMFLSIIEGFDKNGVLLKEESQ